MEMGQRIIEKLDELDKKRREDKLKREEEERTKEIKNDSKPKTKEVPNEKTIEPAVVLPEEKTKGNTEKTKDMEVEPKERRKTIPRELKKTKEEIEMMNHGLICLLYTSGLV